MDQESRTNMFAPMLLVPSSVYGNSARHAAQTDNSTREPLRDVTLTRQGTRPATSDDDDVIFVSSNPKPNDDVVVVASNTALKRKADNESPEDQAKKKVRSEKRRALQEQAEADDKYFKENSEEIMRWYQLCVLAHERSNKEWELLAKWKEFKEGRQARAKPAPRRQTRSKSPSPQCEYRQGEKLPGDKVPCPKIPSAKYEDYPRFSKSGPWRSFTEDTPDCGTTYCTKEKHHRCRTGYEKLEDFEIAAERHIERRLTKIETLIDQGKLDSAHKTWEGWYDGDLAKRKNVEKRFFSLEWTELGRRRAEQRRIRVGKGSKEAEKASSSTVVAKKGKKAAGAEASVSQTLASNEAITVANKVAATPTATASPAEANGVQNHAPTEREKATEAQKPAAPANDTLQARRRILAMGTLQRQSALKERAFNEKRELTKDEHILVGEIDLAEVSSKGLFLEKIIDMIMPHMKLDEEPPAQQPQSEDALEDDDLDSLFNDSGEDAAEQPQSENTLEDDDLDSLFNDAGEDAQAGEDSTVDSALHTDSVSSGAQESSGGFQLYLNTAKEQKEKEESRAFEQFLVMMDGWGDADFWKAAERIWLGDPDDE